MLTLHGNMGGIGIFGAGHAAPANRGRRTSRALDLRLRLEGGGWRTRDSAGPGTGVPIPFEAEDLVNDVSQHGVWSGLRIVGRC
jgi:hypothetical protein